MWYWSVAILFWQQSIDRIVNGQFYGFAKTRLRHPFLPFYSPTLPVQSVDAYVRTLGQSRDNQTKRGWPYSMSMGPCPTRASRAREPRYNVCRLLKSTVFHHLPVVFLWLITVFKLHFNVEIHKDKLPVSFPSRIFIFFRRNTFWKAAFKLQHPRQQVSRHLLGGKSLFSTTFWKATRGFL